MSARPGFIEIGGVYYATIKVGSVETVLKRGDKRIPFESAVAAVAAARRALKPLPPATPSKTEAVDVFGKWKREKADELSRLRDDFTLAGIKVEQRRPRRIRP